MTVDRSYLDDLIKRSVAAVKAMSPTEKKEMFRQQAVSWVYGNIALSNPLVTREMVEKALDEHNF